MLHIHNYFMNTQSQKGDSECVMALYDDALENAMPYYEQLKHLWSDYLELAEDYRHTPELRRLYDHRKETTERVFADAKEKHSMRFTYFRGLTRVTNWVRLKFAAMNLKKYVLHRRLYCFFSHLLSSFSAFKFLAA